ncbi:MAG: hypothetical protein JSS82_15350 [Bacteroidetes bacterium]|nr:hypothetical protein [Bacteroidota bacterium]
MKQLILLSLSIALCANIGFSQARQQTNGANATPTSQDLSKREVQGIPIMPYVKGQTEQMTKELALTGAQQNSVTKVNTMVAIKRSDIERMTDTKQIKDAKAALAIFSAEEYKKVLSPEQYAKWDKMQHSSAGYR